MIQAKIGAIIFSLLILLAVLLPITENWKTKPKDNFPLSYYPMFSAKRTPEYTVNYIVGYDSLQNRHTIPYSYVGAGGFNQVRRQLNKNVKRKKYKQVANRVAKKVSRSSEAPFRDLKEVHLVQGTYHLDTYFTSDLSALEETTLYIKQIER